MAARLAAAAEMRLKSKRLLAERHIFLIAKAFACNFAVYVSIFVSQSELLDFSNSALSRIGAKGD